MEAIKKLTFVKVYQWNRETFLRFDLPAENKLDELKQQFPGYEDFKHLDFSNMYSGFIRARLISKDCKDETKCSIHQLLKEIKEGYVNEDILEGHTISGASSESFNLTKWKTTLIENKLINKSFTSIVTPSETYETTNAWEMINVGHGLSVINKSIKVVYDAGGQMSHYDFWLNQIERLGSNITFIISHAHLDHYNFLEKYIRDGNSQNIHRIIFNSNSSFDRKSAKSIFKLMRDKGMALSEELDFNGCGISIPSQTNKNENDNSLLLKHNDILFTGDQRYLNIENKCNINEVKILQVPHHGSFGDQTGTPQHEWWDKVSAYVSVGNRYGLPSTELSKSFPMNRITKACAQRKILVLEEIRNKS